MRTSDLPRNLVVLFLISLCPSPLISGCSSRKTKTVFSDETDRHPCQSVININTAPASDLQTLPHVGPVLAAKIIEHRIRYGPFRRPEHVLLVEGVSEERFREFREFINTE